MEQWGRLPGGQREREGEGEEVREGAKTGKRRRERKGEGESREGESGEGKRRKRMKRRVNKQMKGASTI